MNELVEVAHALQLVCDRHHWNYCIIGGLALQHWGEPRMTRDVDMTLLAGFGDEEPVVDALLEEYTSRIPEARQFALRNRVLLLKSPLGIGIDIALGALPFEERAIARAQMIEAEAGILLKLCSAEDLVVMKAFANRPQDWIDIEGIIIRQGAEQLDWNQIRKELRPLAETKGEPSILGQLDELRLRHA